MSWRVCVGIYAICYILRLLLLLPLARNTGGRKRDLAAPMCMYSNFKEWGEWPGKDSKNIRMNIDKAINILNNRKV